MRFTRERKRLWLAIAGSIVVHLLVAFSLAAFGRPSAPLPDPEDRPVELTMIDLSATPPPVAVPAKPTYVETDPANESKVEPTDKTFESNANSVAKSNAPASGDLPIPSQEGKERPFIEMQTQPSSLPSQGAQAQPSLTPPPVATPPPPTSTPAQTPKPTAEPKKSTPPPKATPLPEPLATPQPDQLAMLTGTPPPAIRDPDEVESTPPPQVEPTVNPALARPRPQRPASAYQPEKQQARMTGRITDRGPSSVAAVGTPLGRYQKTVSDAIGALWYRFMKDQMDLVDVGTAHIEAEVDGSGKVLNLRVVSNNANEAFANVCLRSFQEAKIPPIPPDLVATLPGGRLPVDFYFTTYANR
ncbi:MAG: hypothetical protein ABIR71_03015 [Chthoniobacterales bacterium]